MQGLRSSFFRIALLISSIFVLAHCGLTTGGGPSAKIKYPNKVSPEMKSEFDLIEKDFEAQHYKTAEPAYRSYAQKYPYNALTDVANFRIGQILMLKPSYAEATSVFSQLIQKTPDPAMASRARVKAGISQYRLGAFQDALNFFDRADANSIQTNDQIKLGSLGLRAVERLNGSLEHKGYYYAVLVDSYDAMGDAEIRQKYGQESPSTQDVQNGLSAWAKAPAGIGQLDSRLLTYRAGRSEPEIDYKLGMTYAAANEYGLAKKYLSRLASKNPNSPLTADARPVLDKVGAKVGKEPKPSGKVFKIGVILPLSGKYQVYGANTLKGMECAASAKPGCNGVKNIQLVVRDDVGDANQAVAAVDDLVTKERVVAIVGPLSSGSSLAAAKRAQELGVPMISLAQKEGIPATGDFIFRFSLTPQEQVNALLTYAAQQKGKKLLAVLYPNTNYGKVFLSTMQAMAPQVGAKVSASQGFSSTANFADDLRQLKFSVSETTANAPLGFDGLFIPDSYASVLKILPQLKNSGIENVLLLGTNAWNDPSLAKKSGGQLGDSAFLDVYFKDSSNPLVKSFTQEFQSVYGSEPSTLEAMGYDSVRFLGQAISRRKISQPADVKNAIATMGGYQGVTGLKSFQSDREANVDPVLLTVEGESIKELKK